MKVMVFIKTRGVNKGDIQSIHPLNGPHGKLMLRSHYPIVMELDVPCGEKYNKFETNCPRCEFNDPDQCDIQKFEKGIWLPGKLLEPPKLDQKRKYKIDFESVLTEQEKIDVEKEVYTEEEKADIYTRANLVANEKTTAIILEKE